MNNWFFKFAWSVMRPVSHILFRLQIEGTEHLPAHGAMLCANHSSNWDPVLIAIALPRITVCGPWQRTPCSAFRRFGGS